MGPTCAACGTARDEQARFCASCGAASGGPPPAHLERKLATALFADVVGSTALAEREDPEVVHALLGRAFERVERQIGRHGGLVEKFIGDAVLGVFGVPQAHEDDAERAVRAASAVMAEIEELDRDLAKEGRPPLAFRIGIEAGEVLVDLDRVGGSRDRMITGDPVNTAARLEQAAEPGQIVVGPGVHAATKEQFEYLELPAKRIEGKVAPVEAWCALRARAAEPGQRVPLRLQARLVGRRGELATLAGALQDVCRDGSPRLVTIVGPAGIGKSRLAHEFLLQLRRLPGPVTIHRGRCIAYGDVSYSALVEVMKAECGVVRGDSPAAVEARTAATLERLFGDRVLLPHLEALIGSGRERSFGREDLFDAWRRMLERMAATSPLVLVLEDLHWADDGLLDFAEHVARWASGPILVLALARPELLDRRPGWDGRTRNSVSLALDPLTGTEAEMILEDLIGARIPQHLARVVLEPCEGNPLFCEEIVRMLVDRGAIRSDEEGRWALVEPVTGLQVPRSIQSLLAARLDALAADEKAILQDASVVGRTFWAGALRRLSMADDEVVERVLDRLWAKDLIAPRKESSLSGEREYAFHHVLIRDVAYDSLPKGLRADKHIAVARWAEDQAGDRSEGIAELLATHHLQALRWLDELGETDGRRPEVEAGGYRWSRVAGERARRLWQQGEAVRWLRVALDLGGRTGRDDGELALLWESCARALDGAAAVPEVVHAWEEALARYRRAGSAADVGRVEASIAYASAWEGQARDTEQLATRAVGRLEPLGESGDLAFALYVLGHHLLERGELDRAEPLLRRAMAIAGRAGDQATQANATISLGWTLHARRRGDETVRLLDRALEIARSAHDLSLLLDALEAVLSAAVEVSGDYERAEALNLEAVEVARRAGNFQKLGRAQLNLGYLFRELGRLDAVAEPILAAREAAAAVGDSRDVAWTYAVEALLDCTRANLRGARESIGSFRALLERVDVASMPYVEEITGVVDGYIAMGEGRDDVAATLLVDAHHRVRDERLSIWFGQTLLFECVRAARLVGRLADARDARDRLEQLGSSNVPPRAFLAWADGLLAPDPVRAHEWLAVAAARLEALDRRIDLGRCLLDLAAAEARLGHDGRPARLRGLRILRTCGARLFLPRGAPGRSAATP
jgi:class 3 adenylate cyclase/tetratricopeptide (TPR) repeat protein